MEEEIDDRDAHGFLRACYLNTELPVGTRIKASAIAIGHEKPKLEAVAVHHLEGDLGDRLDRAIAKYEALKIARGLLIEGKAQEIKEEPEGSP